MRRKNMNKVVLAIVEWLAYVVAAIAIGSLLRVTVVIKPTAQEGPPRLVSASPRQETRGTPSQLLRIAAAPSAPAAHHQAPAAHDQAELIRLGVLLTAVSRFKELSLGNYERALLMFGTDRVAAKFKQLNEAIWTDTPPRVGWSYFMSSSVHVVAAVGRTQPLVAFYNPWSDVFLITEWRLDPDLPRLVDAEMLMGDWLRSGDELNPIPHWLRTDLFKPHALGASVAESVQQFEKHFHDKRPAPWRERLAVLHTPQLLVDVNYPAVALMLLTNLQSVHDFRSVKPMANALKASCRQHALEVVRTGAKGRFASLHASATDTLARTWDVLNERDAQWFRTLEAVTVLTSSDGCMVFLTPVFDASASLALFFKGDKTDLKLQRVDLVDYTGYYRTLQEKGDALHKDTSL